MANQNNWHNYNQDACAYFIFFSRDVENNKPTNFKV